MTLRPGLALQNFVAALERMLTDQAGVTIDSPKYLPDKDTGQPREHDVVITRRDAHHTILTAIEVRDTGRKVGVPAVEAFAAKCEKTGIHHPVMVSSSGFTETALTKAAAKNVACMRLSEAEAFDWMGIEFFIQIERQIPHIDAEVFFTDTRPTGMFKLLDAAGTEMTPPHLAHAVYRALDENDLSPPVDQETPVSVRVQPTGWTCVAEDGQVHAVDYVMLRGSVSVKHTARPVKLHSYEGAGGSYSVVSTDVNVGKVAGQILFVRDQESIRVAFAANGDPEKQEK